MGIIILVCFLVDTEPLLDQFLLRVPSLNNVEVQQLATCFESATPDGKYVMGGVPEVWIKAFMKFYSSVAINKM
jgi:hypothetical protein